MPTGRDDRARLAALMNERRIELGLRWDDVAEAGDVSAETLRVVRRSSAPLRDLTKVGIERGLQWERGSVDRVLAGEEAVPVSTPGALDLDIDPDIDFSMLTAQEQRDLVGAVKFVAGLLAKVQQREQQHRRGA